LSAEPCHARTTIRKEQRALPIHWRSFYENAETVGQVLQSTRAWQALLALTLLVGMTASPITSRPMSRSSIICRPSL
jgi:hypothetical protein